ncbi:hypothetical protein GCM10023340_07490 [Nocardioides marinquilinus]|uniref:DUF5642 domain-containing protein n=1 Tax=Nocardioides marinquilinus TaxID=1210400 RepID=A0ABP9PEJ3_9ACTN
MRLPRLTIAALLATVALASGCGGDDEDAGPERSELAENLAATFEKAGVGTGDGRTYCLALDDEGAGRVAEALGIGGATFEDSANLIGTGSQDARVQCSFVPDTGDELPVGLVVRTTDDDLDEAVAPARDSSGRAAEITERTVDGLDDGTVVTLDQGGEYGQAVWVQDGVYVALGAPPETADLDALLAALPVLVEEVDRTVADD